MKGEVRFLIDSQSTHCLSSLSSSESGKEHKVLAKINEGRRMAIKVSERTEKVNHVRASRSAHLRDNLHQCSPPSPDLYLRVNEARLKSHTSRSKAYRKSFRSSTRICGTTQGGLLVRAARRRINDWSGQQTTDYAVRSLH